MTTEVTSAPEQTKTETPQVKDLSSPNLSFTEYETLRRGGNLPESEATSPSAPAADQAAEQNLASLDSETGETEAKETKQDESEAEGSEEELEAKDTAEKAKPTKKSGFQKRIDKLNARYADKEREAEYWRREALKNGATEAKTETKQEGPKPTVATSQEGKPTPESFDTHAEYVEALTEWKTEQKLAERDRKAQAEKIQSEQQKAVSTYQERVKAFTEKAPDFHEVISEVDNIPVSPAVREIILSSENGPELAYALASDPAEFERVNKLQPLAAAREMGKIESRLATKASAAPAEKTTDQKKITQAPKPIEPVSGGKAQAARKSPEEMSYAEYERYRREQLNRKRGA